MNIKLNYNFRANTELKINFSDIKDFPKEKNSGTNLSDWGSKLEKIIE